MRIIEASYLTASFTGLRRGELQLVEWRDVHLDSETPFILARASTTKNGREAMIFLHPEVAAAIISIRSVKSEPNARVLPRKRGAQFDRLRIAVMRARASSSFPTKRRFARFSVRCWDLIRVATATISTNVLRRSTSWIFEIRLMHGRPCFMIPPIAPRHTSRFRGSARPSIGFVESEPSLNKPASAVRRKN
jgi:hypothetical protein